MQVNGIKSFKIETVDPVDGGAGSDPTATDVGTDLDEIFGDPTGSATSTTDDWIVTSDATDSAMVTLSDYPPSLDYILAQNEAAVRYLDVIKERYINTKEGLIALRDNYQRSIGSVTSEEAGMLARKIELVDRAIMKCDQEIAACARMIGEAGNQYDQEMSAGKDLNGDGWIGRPGSTNALKVIYQDGKPYFMDSNGNMVTNPFMDPDYEATVLSDDAVTLLDPEDTVNGPIGLGTEGASETDLYFRLNDLQRNYESETNKFGTPINIGVPEYIWVPREGDSWNPALDDEADDLKYKFDADLWEGGVQKVPANKSEYVQVRVAEVVVSSEEVPGITASDGGKIYNTIVELKDNEGTTLASFRIEGLFGEGPASTSTTSGSYIAASSVGIGFYGANRSSPVIFDASGYQSTTRHIVSDLSSKLDIPNQSEAAFQENMAMFEGAEFTTTYWQVEGEGTSSTGDWADSVHTLDYGDGYSDAYISENTETTETDSFDCFQTGVFVTGLRGSFTGSNSNDVFDIPDVNFTNDYIEEHTPDGAEPIRTDDPLYTSTVDGKGGSNIVRAGKGNLLADDVSFVWAEATRNDEVLVRESRNYRSYRSADSTDPTASAKILADNKNYFNVGNAGNASLFNGSSETGKSDDVGGFYEGYANDYYEGFSAAADIEDEDIRGRKPSQCGKDEDFTPVWNEFDDPLQDSILGYGASDEEFDAPTQWQTEYGYAAEQDAEMDTFFSDMFGDLNEFDIEMTEMAGDTL